MLFIPYNTELVVFARENRKHPTAPEALMWRMLSRRQFGGYKFTRQKPLLNFIADFYSSSLRLVIEIDGDTHVQQYEYDLWRSDVLHEYGIEVIRYENRQVLFQAEGVYMDLMDRIHALTLGCNPLNPPCQGEI